MSIYLTGDTHGALGRLSSGAWPLGKTLKKSDYLIILGDFGVLWSESDDPSSTYWLKWLDGKPWTTLFLDGNHENFNLLNNLPSRGMFGGTVGVASKSVFHLRRGECYTIDKQKILTVGGALSIDKAYRTEGVSWWPEEMLSEADLDKIDKTLKLNNYEFDYVLTHTCPTRVKDFLMYNSGSTILDITSEQLSLVDNCISYKRWYFGHFHMNKDFFSNYNDEEPSHVCMNEYILELGDFFTETP